MSGSERGLVSAGPDAELPRARASSEDQVQPSRTFADLEIDSLQLGELCRRIARAKGQIALR